MSELKVPDLMIALTLRNEDRLTWPAVTKVMARYHGAYHSPETWRQRSQTIGEARKSPRGRPFEAKS